MQTESKGKPVAKTVSLMMAIILVGKVLGILRDRMQGLTFGTDTVEGIAFMQASSLPRDFLDIMFASVFSASFIPVFNAYLETKEKKAAFDLAALFISFTLVVTAVFTVVCIAGAPAIYTVFLDGAELDPATRPLGISLLRIMFPIMILSGLAFSLTGVLQSLGEFNIPAAMSVVSNAIILVYYFFFIDRFGVYGLCAAFLLGWASQSLIQIPYLIKHKFHFRFRLTTRDPGIRKIASLALPVLAASWVGPVNLIINSKAAINLYDGKYGYNAIHFANNLYTIISGVFVLSIANVIFPALSKQTAAGDNEGFSDTLRATVKSLLFFLLPMTLGLIAVSEPLVRLVYEGGLFRESAVEITATALRFFSLGIVGYGLQIILSRASYALRNGRVPLFAAVVAMGINAVLSFALAPIMQVAGPALASSIAITAAAIILLTVLIKRGHLKWSRFMTVDVLKMVVMAALMFGVVIFCLDMLSARLGNGLAARVLAVAVPVAVGVTVYMAGCLLLGVEDVKKAVGMVLKKLKISK